MDRDQAVSDTFAVVCDDDPEVAAFIAHHLKAEGFDVVVEASPGAAGARLLEDPRSGILLLDLHLDGAEAALRRLRSNPKTVGSAIVVLTHSLDPDLLVGALESGADDFIRKPFEVAEFVARIKSVLRRTTMMIGVSPLTGLPGNHRTEIEIDRRLAADVPTAVAHVDLDNFKAFNDHYGFLRGDHAIAFASNVLQNAQAASGDPTCFVGHIGGDDFVVVMDPARVERFAEAVIDEFDAGILDFYDPQDALRGYIEVPDRRGDRHAFPVVSISLGVATNERRALSSSIEASQVAAEMKEFAKAIPGSTVQVDRRTD
ncbi:MAG: response regulator [Acidimicrobiia bacterium]